MTAVLAGVLYAPRNIWRHFKVWLHDRMPRGLYARALLIVILPIVLLQSAVAYVFMERHWEVVTYRLSAGVAREVAAIVEIHNGFPDDRGHDELRRIAAAALSVELTVLPHAPLPPPARRSALFALLDQALNKELSRRISQPFWVNTAVSRNFVEIRVALNDATLRMLFNESHAYASNSYIFFMWMAIASIIILAVATSFLRNQIRPILRLAEAAEEFGKGLYVRQQMFYASLSLNLYRRDPDDVDPVAVEREEMERLTPYKHVDGTFLHLGFGHLDGYSALYCTYMWSLVIAKDLFTVFDRDGLLNPEAAARYRDRAAHPIQQ